jgi:poly(3-hydroxyalkanoate) synthetase
MILHRFNMLYQNDILKNKKYYFNIFINKKNTK